MSEFVKIRRRVRLVIGGKAADLATLAGQSEEQPSGRLQKVQTLQPPYFLHAAQQSAAVNTVLVGVLLFTSNTSASPPTFCCTTPVSQSVSHLVTPVPAT